MYVLTTARDPAIFTTTAILPLEVKIEGLGVVGGRVRSGKV